MFDAMVSHFLSCLDSVNSPTTTYDRRRGTVRGRGSFAGGQISFGISPPPICLHRLSDVRLSLRPTVRSSVYQGSTFSLSLSLCVCYRTVLMMMVIDWRSKGWQACDVSNNRSRCLRAACAILSNRRSVGLEIFSIRRCWLMARWPVGHQGRVNWWVWVSPTEIHLHPAMLDGCCHVAIGSPYPPTRAWTRKLILNLITSQVLFVFFYVGITVETNATRLVL